MRKKVGIVGAEFFAFHGYYPEENKSGNYFTLDAEAWIEDTPESEDDLSRTLNYESIFAVAKDEMAKPRKLLEAVVENIIKRMKNELNAKHGRVRLEKAAPPMKGKIKASFVEYEF
jgi:7,8-dihydroneopterin aldolase/epimerase/oxygenase